MCRVVSRTVEDLQRLDPDGSLHVFFLSLALVGDAVLSGESEMEMWLDINRKDRQGW